MKQSKKSILRIISDIRQNISKKNLVDNISNPFSMFHFNKLSSVKIETQKKYVKKTVEVTKTEIIKTPSANIKKSNINNSELQKDKQSDKTLFSGCFHPMDVPIFDSSLKKVFSNLLSKEKFIDTLSPFIIVSNASDSLEQLFHEKLAKSITKHMHNANLIISSEMTKSDILRIPGLRVLLAQKDFFGIRNNSTYHDYFKDDSNNVLYIPLEKYTLYLQHPQLKTDLWKKLLTISSQDTHLSYSQN